MRNLWSSAVFVVAAGVRYQTGHCISSKPVAMAEEGIDKEAEKYMQE